MRWSEHLHEPWAGSEISWWATADGADPRSVPLEVRFAGRLVTGPRHWEGGHVLRVLPAGRPYQVIHFWRDGIFTGWYVNFESPVVWRDRVADTRDWHLDLWVMPDGTAS
jgi:predicted RNA-binding protein associated with RNAse of E/G family